MPGSSDGLHRFPPTNRLRGSVTFQYSHESDSARAFARIGSTRQGGKRKPMASAKRKAVVTGAASGIGRAVAERLIADGVSVLAVDVDAARLKEAAPRGCEMFVADVGDPADRTKLAAVTSEHDYLV